MSQSATTKWEIGQEVIVASRTWPGINKPGGHGKIIQIHYSSVGIVDSIDVKYTLGGGIDTNLETDLVKPHIELERGRRSRRGRDFFTVEAPAPAPAASKCNKNVEHNKENSEPTTKTSWKKKASKTEDAENSSSEAQTLQKKRKKQATKPPRASSEDDESPLPADASNTGGAAAKKKKQKKAPNEKVTAAAATKKKAAPPKPENKLTKSRSSIPKFIGTSDTVVVKTVSPLNDGGTGDPSSGLRQQPWRISDNGSTGMSQASFSSTKANKAQRTPSPAVFHNNSKTADTADPIVERKTLKHVYEGHVQDAKEYIDYLMGSNDKNNSSSKPKAQQEKQPPRPEVPRFVKPPEKTAEQRLEEERGQEFGRHFSSLMERYDSVLQEDELLGLINQCLGPSKKPFTPEEAECYVSKLCAENKIMKSDGCLYGF